MWNCGKVVFERKIINEKYVWCLSRTLVVNFINNYLFIQNTETHKSVPVSRSFIIIVTFGKLLIVR